MAFNGFFLVRDGETDGGAVNALGSGKIGTDADLVTVIKLGERICLGPGETGKAGSPSWLFLPGRPACALAAPEMTRVVDGGWRVRSMAVRVSPASMTLCNTGYL